jgi:hypothetical protein
MFLGIPVWSIPLTPGFEPAPSGTPSRTLYGQCISIFISIMSYEQQPTGPCSGLDGPIPA